jgi:probable F420-dependent oxidoreductase
MTAKHDTVSVVPEGVLAYGMQLPVQALSMRTSMEWERSGSDVTDLVEVAKACDRAGFFYVGVCDHIAIPRSHADAMGTQWYDPVPTLAYLAALTNRTRLLTNVYIAAYRHPLQTAKAFATLDALSGGRVILGVGAGHVEAEFEFLDVSFAERGRITNDAIDAIVAAWLDEWPEIDTPTWQVHDVGQRPRPVQSPRPPVWVGGMGKPALRRVAERGDGWIPMGNPRTTIGADIEYLLAHRDKVRPGQALEVGFITELVYVGDADWDLPRGTVTGSPAAIVESFNELGRMGVAHLQLRFAARSRAELCEQVERFGVEVGPHLTRNALD